jgi:hypothetical protein
MATRSRIGIKNVDGSVTAVYCHWDGYLSYVGKLLFEVYNTEEKIRELLSYGNISSLTDTIGEKHEFHCSHPYGSAEYEAHAKITTFYGRDRGEQGQAAYTYISEHEYRLHREQYTYLFQDGAWTYLAGNRWVKLTERNTL